MNTRVYNEKVNINNKMTKEFWKEQGSKTISLKSVLLGKDFQNNVNIIRNQREFEIVDTMTKNLSSLKILDIGCGIGRWAENFKDKLDLYTGIDYTEGFIDYAQHKYADYKNINFMRMSILDLNPSDFVNKYNLILCCGVLMYINDNDISNILKTLKSCKSEYMYIQESISLMSGRLTLNNFESKELKTNYSAIYRTKSEYENYFKQNDISVINTGLLLDSKIGAREETNAPYWILKG